MRFRSKPVSDFVGDQFDGSEGAVLSFCQKYPGNFHVRFDHPIDTRGDVDRSKPEVFQLWRSSSYVQPGSWIGIVVKPGAPVNFDAETFVSVFADSGIQNDWVPAD